VLGLTQGDLLHGGFVLLFLATLMRPGRVALIRYTLLYAAAALVVLYVGALGRYPALGSLLWGSSAGSDDASSAVLRVLGMWRVTVADDCAPVLALVLLTAGCLYTFKALVRVPGGAPTSAAAAAAAGTLVGALGGGASMQTPGRVRQLVGLVVDACGAYIILVALLGLVVCSPRTLSTLGFLAIGLGCVIKPLPISPVRALDELSVCCVFPRRERRVRAANTH
jgi:hypothetical protein